MKEELNKKGNWSQDPAQISNSQLSGMMKTPKTVTTRTVRTEYKKKQQTG